MADYDRVVEVGIGRRDDVAAALATQNVTVVATDITTCTVPESVSFVLDDITAPDMELYEAADAIYALNLPPELHRPTAEIAERVGADFLFTTLGGDPPAVPVRRETIPGDTVFVFDPAQT